MPKTRLLKPLLCVIALCFSLQAKLQIITTAAGNGYGGYSGDGGFALSANVRSQGVCFDSHDNMFIPDHYDNVVRKVSKRLYLIFFRRKLTV